MFLLTHATSYAQSEIYPEHFDLEEITLLDGPLNDAMRLNDSILMRYNVNRLLTTQVVQAGLHQTTGTEYTNWDSRYPVFSCWYYDVMTPHYVSALSLAYAASHDDEMKEKLKERLNYCISVLKDCQDVFDEDTSGLRGYIGMQNLTNMWREVYDGRCDAYYNYFAWNPFYPIHKMQAGLRDAWIYGDDERAKDMFRKFSDWCVNLISNVTDSQLQDMLNAEHGGVAELLADAYRLLGDQKYLNASKRYCHQWLLNGMQSENHFLLNGTHANTQVPKAMGFERIYQEEMKSGINVERKYRTAAHNFWHEVAENRTVCIGGNSIDEHFLSSDQGSKYIEHLNGPESCNSYNMMKLSEILFDETHDARFADFYEQTQYNHILSTQNPKTGGYVYFTPLRPQAYRIYSSINRSFWCCVGTGMENHSRYGHFVYTHSKDNKILYVNLFTASKLESDIFAVTQVNNYPYESSTRITVDRGGDYVMAIRHPQWTTDGYSIRVNGEQEPVSVAHGEAGYVMIRRQWQKGDVVEVDIPMELRYEECPDNSNYIAFKYGPVLLAAKTTASSFAESRETGLKYQTLSGQFAGEGRWEHAPNSMTTPLPISSAPKLVGKRTGVLGRITPTDNPLEFVIDVENADNDDQSGWKSLILRPFFNVHQSRYCIYWLQTEDYREPKAYRFVASDWIAIDPNRVTQDKITYDMDENTITVEAGMGQNNVCVQLDYQNAPYYVTKEQKILLVEGENLSLREGASYLWWLNGTNKASSVSPDYSLTAENGHQIIAWDITKSGINDTAQGNRWEATNGYTCFGLTSTTGKSKIYHIGFETSVDSYINSTDIKTLEQDENHFYPVYDLSGRVVIDHPVNSRDMMNLPGGVYIVNKRKIIIPF